MRSLIKGHRRTDSSTSESANGHSDLQPRAYHRHANKTPQASPKISSSASNLQHMTPPRPQYQGSSSTLSSPKKLLTPIKKMFGHHSASKTSAPTSFEALHTALNSDGPPSRPSNPGLHSPRSMSNLNELPSLAKGSASPSWTRPGPHATHARHQSTSFLESAARVTAGSKAALIPNESKSSFTLGGPFESSSTLNSGSTQQREKMKIMDEDALSPVLDSVSALNDSDSNRSIAKSINFSAKQASSQEILAGSSSRSNTDDFEDDIYSSDEMSDTSSQFSFVKDVRGGRNTSVKYYKTKPSKPPAEANGVQSNTFGVEDFGFEEDGLSDYDYENNGLDDDDDIEDFEGKYEDFVEENSILLDEDLRNELSPPPAPQIQLEGRDLEEGSSSDDDGSARYESHDHFITANSSHNFLTPQPEDHPYGEDFLESYMDNTKSPGSEIPATPLSQVFNLPSLNTSSASSPLINGVTFGAIDGFKSRQIVSRARSGDKAIDTDVNEVEETKPEEAKKSSIMELLGALELKTYGSQVNEGTASLDASPEIKTKSDELREDTQATEPKDSRRQSVIDMMDTLSALAISTEAQPVEKKEARKSVIDMMDTLAALDLANMSNIVEPKVKSTFVTATPEENKSTLPTQSTPSHSFSEDTSTEDARGYLLDEEMLFECNQLPEDFEFESYQNNDTPDGVADFYRSNSYNKKPTKMVRDNSVRSNKIETPQRTVTFYRTNSLAKPDEPSAVALSRNGTLYSALSVTSGEDESIKDSEKYRQMLPYAYNANLQLKERSFDCLSHKSFSLEPITESEMK